MLVESECDSLVLIDIVILFGECMHYRAVFISDLHLGTPGCQAEALLDFLKSHTSDTLYLVGDIVDGWQLRRKWYWPQAHNDVVQKLLRRVRKGSRVVYIPGNHDEFARDFVEHHLVTNGCSELIGQVFGEKGAHARSAFGVAQLPMGACVEIELIAELA